MRPSEFIKMVREEIEAMPRKKLPKIFSATAYRLPTLEELIDVNNHNLSVDEIINGFKYTIIGRGIKTKQNKKMIIQSIEMLSKLYPNNNIYKEAFDKISQEYGQISND